MPTHTHTHTHTHALTHVLLINHADVSVFIYFACVHTHICTYSYLYMYVCMCVYIRVYPWDVVCQFYVPALVYSGGRARLQTHCSQAPLSARVLLRGRATPRRRRRCSAQVVSVHLNPADPRLMMTAGNDYHARLWDVRCLSEGAPGNAGALAAGQVGAMAHPRVVNSAYFSPITGTKILTTCQDNRLRVYDNAALASGPPSRTIVHSHDFNRYLTPFRAEWCPQDLQESTFLVGRYISEAFDGAALHPVDIMDANSGQVIRQLIDMNLTTISPVNAWHPHQDVIVSGSSGSLYAWRPDGDTEQEEEAEATGAGGAPAPGLLPSSYDGFMLYDAFAPEQKKRRR
mmetsp:Transcript_9104/g.23283  ORF Transcript_9104/g.23283 Transcript_9104/m.23283 type:complete len:344 (-) Transcript_9104:41-1072(-)